MRLIIPFFLLFKRVKTINQAKYKTDLFTVPANGIFSVSWQGRICQPVVSGLGSGTPTCTGNIHAASLLHLLHPLWRVRGMTHVPCHYRVLVVVTTTGSTGFESKSWIFFSSRLILFFCDARYIYVLELLENFWKII